MFDYHMHSTVSFDGHDAPEDMVKAALSAGLKEICFTDHIDHQAESVSPDWVFDLERYCAAYDSLSAPGLLIRKGMEFGMSPDNAGLLAADLKKRPYDYVIGSVHFCGNQDVYEKSFWEGKTPRQVYPLYLEEMLRCVQAQDDFDVLGHLTYICKCRGNPTKEPLKYGDHREILDEILKILVSKGKGLELNTSGVDRCGFYLPEREFFLRFRELGGRIVTVGSDAHTAGRVGQYTAEACRLLGDIFGYVCTFENRNPIFHKL